jgi:hypothetical protein
MFVMAPKKSFQDASVGKYSSLIATIPQSTAFIANMNLTTSRNVNNTAPDDVLEFAVSVMR